MIDSIYRNEIEMFCKNIAQEKKYENYDLKILPHVVKGEGFLGKVFFVTISSPKKEQCLNIVVKLSLTDEIAREQFKIKQMYQHEIIFYSEIYPTYLELEKENGIRDLSDYIPEFLGHVTKPGYEILFLDNIKSRGYELFNKRELFDEDHIKLVLQELAKIHAASFAYKDQHPENLKNFIQPIVPHQLLFVDVPFIKDMIHTLFSTMKDTVDHLGDTELSKKYSKYVENPIELAKKALTYDPEYSVIVHGDCWSNNMMFKYDETPGSQHRRPRKVCFYDWQLLDYVSPVRDIAFCIFTSCRKEIYDDLETYLNIYHEQLSTRMKQLGSDPDLLYPYARFKEDWKKHGIFGMYMGFIMNKTKLTDENDLINFENTSTSDSKYMEGGYDKDEFEKRFLNILLHMYQTNLL